MASILADHTPALNALAPAAMDTMPTQMKYSDLALDARISMLSIELAERRGRLEAELP